MAISKQRQENYQKVREAVLDTYHAAQQVTRGDLSVEEAERARQLDRGGIREWTDE